MSNKNQESIKLLIEAEYLAEEEFNQATADVKELAKVSEKTDKALDQLEVDKETIKSYGLLGNEINDLKDEIDQATLAQKEAAKEHGKSSKEYKKSARAVKVLNQDLTSLKKTYNAQGTALKKYRVDSKNVEQTVTDLNTQIAKSAQASKEQAKALKDASAELERATVKQRALASEKKKLAEVEEQLANERKQLASTMKAEFQAQDKLNKATKDAIAQKKKEADAVEKSVLAKKEEAKQLNRTKNNLAEYENGLKRLNEERREGYLSQGDWIRAEDKLRKELSLSTSQVNTHKKALEADEKQLKDNAKALQTVSQRLKDAIAQKKKEADAVEKSVLAKKEEAKQLNRTKNNLAEYENGLKRLNEERREGYISQGDWIRAEDKLRKELSLSTSQVNTHKKALEADEKQLKDNAKALQTVSQRLDLYTKELKELNKQKSNGLITSTQLAAKEKELRKQYRLSENQVKQTRKEIEKQNKTLKKSKSSTDTLTHATRRLAQAYTLLLAGGKAIEAIGSSVKQFGAVEAGMTKVEKTTNLARESVEELKNELNDMAVNITPTATAELLHYAEIAGQLGVSSKQGILDLVVASDALQSSTNLAGEEAVTLLTRMLMMSGEGVEGIHNLSSAVVELGNTTATTEDQIVHMGKEILTAGASIGISTDQAVAWGATLKEAGQTAERSRTAIQRLALMIKKASVEGGEDLLKLTKITGLTSEAIQKGLGEEPEKILLAFVQGLDRIKESGGVVATTLEDVGIKSLESQAVLEKLGDVSLRLAENMRTSAQASQDANRHLIEASKAYADQESAIGRVVNRLKVLQERMGEAFSDDTNKSVKLATEVIEEYEEAIIQLGEITSDTMAGIVEFGATFDEVFDATGEVLSKLSAVFKGFFNAVQSGMDAIILGFQGIAYGIAYVSGESKEQLEYISQGMENTKDRILKNNQDMADAQSLLFGEMSNAYIGLRDSINENEEAVKSLTESQRLELKGMMRNGAYREEDNKRYRELTHIITRQTRAMAIADEQAEANAKNERSRANEKIKSDQKQAESTEKAKQLFSDLFEEEKRLSDYTKELGESLENGAISQGEYNEKLEVATRLKEINTGQTKELTDAQDLLNQKRIEEIETVTSFVELTKNETEASTNLIESIQKKEAEVKKLEIAQVGLNKESKAYIALQAEITELTTNTIAELKELNELRELEDLTLSQVLEVQEKHISKLAELKRLRDEDKLTIQEYNEEVEKLSTVTEFLNSNLSDVIATQQKKSKEDEKAIKNAGKAAKAKKEEADLAKKTAQQNEYEAKTVKELVAIKIDHDKALDNLLLQYENGEITWAKYQLELGKMQVITDILSKALANNTNEVARNIDKINEQSEAMSRNEKIAEKFAKRSEQRALTQATMLAASKSGFDATTASTQELSEEINTLEDRIIQNSRVMRGSWFYELAQAQVALDKASMATAKQAKEVLRLKESYDSLGTPTRRATEEIERSIEMMGDLDDATLNGLRDEVDDTIDAFNNLRESINSSLDSVEDRLSSLKGEEQAIQDREQKRELEEAEKLRDSATGDEDAVKKANELISKLKQAHSIEKENLKKELDQEKLDAAQNEQASAEYSKTASSSKSTTSSSIVPTINTENVQPIIINLDNRRVALTANKDDIMELLTDMGYTIS